MVGMTALDLRPYGLRLTLTPDTDVRRLGLEVLSSAHRSRGASTHYNGFVVGGIPYIAREKMSGGAYADLYKVEHKGVMYACKINKDMETTEDLRAFLCETLIHIVLLQASVGEVNGPYVPYLYKVGFDKSTRKTYVITEWISHTLEEDIAHRSREENDKRLPTVLAQVAHILTFFGTTLRFNHRDLHQRNVMITKSLKRVVLIDFGYSCLNWNGLNLRGGFVRDDVEPCYKEDRDIPFLCFRLYKFFDIFLSPHLLHVLHTMIKGTAKEQPCNMGALCPEHGLPNVNSSYEFLDDADVRMPLGTTKRAEELLRHTRPPRQSRTQSRPYGFFTSAATTKTQRRTRKAKLAKNRGTRTVQIKGL